MQSGRKLFSSMILWGVALWLFGYILGIILFMIVPANAIGWIITPAATIFTIWVLIKKIKSDRLADYLLTGIIWACMAILLDYFLLVKVFDPEGGYYKTDVYLYYAITLCLPVLVGLWKINKAGKKIN